MQNLYVTISTADEFYVTGLKKTESEDFDWKKVTLFTWISGPNTDLTIDEMLTNFTIKNIYVSLINNSLNNI
jgi:hypothetical protein